MAYGSAPEWMAALGIGPGDYLCATKPQLAAAAESESMQPVGRIFCCLLLHTAGYQQELAVRMERGRKVPLTPGDVCRMARIDRRHFRRYAGELERDGLIRCEGSTKGRVLLYVPVKPSPPKRHRHREPNPPPRRSASVSATIPSEGLSGALVTMSPQSADIPKTLQSVMRRFKISPKPGIVPRAGDNLRHLELLARMYLAMEIVLREGLKRHCAQAPNKEERLERVTTSSSSYQSEATTTEGANAPAPDAATAGPPEPLPRIANPAPNRRDTPRASVRPPLRTERRRAVPRPPQPHTDNGGGRGHGGPGASDSAAENQQNTAVLCDPPVCPPDVADAIRKAIGTCDRIILDSTWQACRKACDDLAPDELVQFVREVAPRVCQPRNHSWPVVMRAALINAVADRDEVLKVRRRLAEWRERERDAEVQREREIRYAYHAGLLTPEEKQYWLEIYPRLAESP